MQPLFSIIIPLYNKQNYIAQTLQSVLNQSLGDFELIVIDDGSTDASAQVVNSFTDSRLKLITTKNHGVSKARNLGASEAKSHHLVFLDADDQWYNGHLSDLKFLLESYPNKGMYCKAYDKDYGHCKQTTHLKSFPTNWHGEIEDYFESASKFSVATSSSVLIPKNIFDAVGGFNTGFNSGEDTDLWIKIALNYAVIFYNKISVSINMHSQHKVTFKSPNLLHHFDIDAYTAAAKNNRSLDKYLHLNRYTRLIKLKFEQPSAEAKDLENKLNKKYLNTTQKILLHMPKSLLKLVFWIQRMGKRFNVHLTTFK